MQAIRTRYHGPTNFKGSRFSAQCEAGRIYVPYDYSLNLDENHRAACDTLRRKLGWVAPHYGAMVGGVFAGDYYWVADDLTLVNCKDNADRAGRSPVSFG